MAGNEKKNSVPIKTTESTPSYKKEGVIVPLPLAKLQKYELNIRVFHPNKNFETQGFRFHGDNRGFSMDKSWFGQIQNGPTSRIWQRYSIDTSISEIKDFNDPDKYLLVTESNRSDSGPGLWKYLSEKGENYENKAYKPRGSLHITELKNPHPGQKSIRLISHLAGENHAFRTSTMQQDFFKKTAVPTLDAYNELFIRIERVQSYIDILSLTYGDGFPNCESFIMDGAGGKLFLGSHVRIGFPSTHLWNENKRLIWANAIRIEIDKDGNFLDKLWIFSQVLGGPPSLRDDYPVSVKSEVCSARYTEPKSIISSGLINPDRGKFLWNCGDEKEILEKSAKNQLPLYLSAYSTSLDSLREKIEESWKIEPKNKTTRTEWNNYHLHRDPNQGRSRDDEEYQIEDKKWK